MTTFAPFFKSPAGVFHRLLALRNAGFSTHIEINLDLSDDACPQDSDDAVRVKIAPHGIHPFTPEYDEKSDGCNITPFLSDLYSIEGAIERFFIETAGPDVMFSQTPEGTKVVISDLLGAVIDEVNASGLHQIIRNEFPNRGHKPTGTSWLFSYQPADFAEAMNLESLDAVPKNLGEKWGMTLTSLTHYQGSAGDDRTFGCCLHEVTDDTFGHDDAANYGLLTNMIRDAEKIVRSRLGGDL